MSQLIGCYLKPEPVVLRAFPLPGAVASGRCVKSAHERMLLGGEIDQFAFALHAGTECSERPDRGRCLQSPGLCRGLISL